MAPDGPDRSPSGRSYALLVLASASYFGYLFVWFSLPAFLRPVIVDLGLTTTEAGVVAGAIQLVYVPLALVSGLAIDRVGSRHAITAGVATIGVAHALRSGATGFASLLAPTLLLGVGGTAVTFGLPKLVSELFPPGRLGTTSSVYVVGAGLGSATAFALGRPVLGPLAGGWRPLFLASGVALVGYAAAWAVASAVLWRGVERFDGGADPPAFSLGSVRRDVRVVVAHPGLRLLVVVGTMQLFVTHGLQAWLATVLEVRGLAAGTAALVVSLLVVARIAGSVTIPPLSDRYAARRAAVLGAGGLVTAGTLGIVLSWASPWATVAVVVLVGAGLGGLSPLVRAIPVELEGIGPRLTATANGLIYAVGEVGGFLGPFLVGALEDATGSFLPGLSTLVVAGLVVVLAGLVMREPGAGGDGVTAS